MNFTDVFHFRWSISGLMTLVVVCTGWYYVVITQSTSLERSNIASYQAAQMEIVKSCARSITIYITNEIGRRGTGAIPAIEQEVLHLFVQPVNIGTYGDAWIYTPDYAVYDKSADFPEEFIGKSIGDIFKIRSQKESRLNPLLYARLVEGVSKGQPGVTKYVWDPDKAAEFAPWWEVFTRDTGWEIASWTTAVVFPQSPQERVWIVGISSMLTEVMRINGAYAQINSSIFIMILVTIVSGVFVFMLSKGTLDLHKSEEKHRILIEESPDPFFSFSMDGHYTFVNKSFASGLGRQPFEIIGKTIWDVFSKEEADKRFTALQEVFITGEQKVIEVLVPLPHEDAYYLTTITPIKERGNRVISAICSSKNITSRKRAEKQLHHRIAFEHLIADRSSAFLGVKESELDGLLDESLRFVGEFIGADRVYLFPYGDSMRMVTSPHEWCVEGVSPHKEELLALSIALINWAGDFMVSNAIYIPDVSALPQSLSSERITFEHKNIKSLLVLPIVIENEHIGFIGFDSVNRQREWTTEDQSLLKVFAYNMGLAIKRVEQTHNLRLKKDEWEKTFDTIPDPIFIIEKNYKIRQINKTALNLLNISREDALGSKCSAVIHCTESPPPGDCPQAMTLIDKMGHSVERQVARFNNRYYFVTINPVLDSDGKYQASVCIYHDITSHKETETELIKLNRHLEKATALANEMAEKANAASIAKSRFLANMSHEIRTPMNAILGFAQVLERDISLNPTQAEHVRTIIRSGSYLLDIINDILDMSKIEAGKSAVKIDSFSLHDFIEDIEILFRSRAEAKGLQLKVDYDINMPSYVASDEGKLRQILVNLLGNAIKFTQTGEVVVRVHIEEDAGANDQSREDGLIYTQDFVKQHLLVIEVEDSGIGIPDNEIESLFVPFHQAEAGRNSGGTGLGLAISNSLAQIIGGNIKVTSQIGKGSCFTFNVLVSLSDESTIIKKSELKNVVALQESPEKFRILIADDNSENRSFLFALLAPVGFEIREAVNGIEAVEIFQSWSPHAILMDIQMPLMDGYDAILRIKSTDAEIQPLIIAITASVFEDDRKKVMDAGADIYLSKPFKSAELFNALLKIDGLKYTFDDDRGYSINSSQAISPADIYNVLSSLPDSTVASMRQAVDVCDMLLLTKMIQEVERVNLNVANELRLLADQYNYEKLNEYLKKGDERHG